MSKAPLSLKIFFAIVLNDMLDGLAQVMMKKGALHAFAGTFFHVHDLCLFIVQNATSWLLWAGILLYALNFFVWIGILRHIDLSLAVPLGSTSYAVIPLLAMAILHETISPVRWTGIFLIMAGIWLLSKSKSRHDADAPVPMP